MKPTRRWTGLVPDVAPVLGLVVLGLISTALATDDKVRVGDVAPQLVVILPLLARRRWPFVVLSVVAAASVATSMAMETPWVPVAAVALASFTVGERGG